MSKVSANLHPASAIFGSTVFAIVIFERWKCSSEI